MGFKSDIKFKMDEVEKFLVWISEYIDYRGGMGNRIDAFAIQDKLIGKRKYLRSLKKKARAEK